MGGYGDSGLQTIDVLIGDTQLAAEIAALQIGQRQAQIIGAGGQIQRLLLRLFETTYGDKPGALFALVIEGDQLDNRFIPLAETAGPVHFR